MTRSPLIAEAAGDSPAHTSADLPPECLAGLLDAVSDSVIVHGADGRITFWNGGAERIYGWSRQEALGANVHALLQTHAAAGLDAVDQALSSRGNWEGELDQVTSSGQHVTVATRVTLKDAAPGSPRLQISSDVTARKRAEAESEANQRCYDRYVDENLTGSFVMKPDGAIVTCNAAFMRSFGYASPAKACGTNLSTLMRSRTESAELIARVREHRSVERDEIEMRQSNGEHVYVAARLVGSFDDAGELIEIQGYLFNDTRRKRLEEQLIQAQKMEGLGTLAGGIAHDFNNILAIILGYANQLEQSNGRPESIPGAVKVIRESVDRGATLVQQLLTSARQAEARFASLNLNELVQQTEKMLRSTFPKMINFETDLHPEAPMITADHSQIHQVLLNLCVNARDSMNDGGMISLETSVVGGSKLAEYFTGADADEYACISVSDTGSGMTPDVRAHIFEPFFTTKERGKGTGLGLSVVYGVVNNHGGFVQVESQPDQGATFRIYLPLALQSELIGREAKAGTAATTRDPQTILVVEDEEMLRDLAVQILEGEGYRVLFAKDGLEAVEQFSAHRDEIGLVVCDLGLPKLGGRDVFLRMKEIKPNVRAIVASGYLEPSIRSEILKAGVIDTIQKPYDFRVLLEKIREVIGTAQSSEDQPQLF